MTTRARLSMTVYIVAAATALLVAGCGDDGEGGSDPATLAPANTPIYIEGAIRPEGELRTDTEAAIEAVSGFSNAGARLTDLLNLSLAEASDLTYEEDIEPWLGERAAVAVTGFADDESFAVIVEATDSGAAEDFVARAAETEQDVREESYEGTDYRVDGDGFAIGVLDGFVVGAGERAFKQLVDGEGDSLADDSTFTETLDAASAGSLVDVYVDIEDAIEAAGDQVDPAALGVFESSFGDLSGKTVLTSLVPSGESIELDVSTNVDAPVEPGDVSALLGSLPADSWGVFGVANLGQAIELGIDQAEQSGAPTELLERQLRSVGVDLQRDILSWPEDLAAFVGGTDLSTLSGAAVITSGDPAASKGAVDKLVTAALEQGEPGVKRLRVPGGAGLEARDPAELGPKPLRLIARGDRVALGYGEEATRRALEGGGQTLSGSQTYEQATGTLGGGVELTGFVSIAPVLDLAEALGALADADYEEARPYLRRLSYLVFGSGAEGDLATTKVVLGLGGE